MSFAKVTAFALLFLAGATAAVGQTLLRPSIDLVTAKKIVAAAEAEAVKNGWSLSISVVDEAGKLVHFVRMDEAPLGTIDVSRGKAETAVNFRMPTKALGEVVGQGASGLLSVKGMIALPGGVPILIDGKLVGAIGVSGGMRGEDDLAAAAGLKVLATKN
jgi:uncharacterized protein GlcG (DUF336 family)